MVSRVPPDRPIAPVAPFAILLRMATLIIEDRTATGTPTGNIDLPDVPDRITLRELIRLRVREEVARYNLAPGPKFVGLVQPDGSIRGRGGYEMPAPRRIEWERQADIAIDSFLRNGFFVMIDGKQETELDRVIVLGADLDIGFIKLTPLVGG
jgi:hypothetical protein